MPPPSAGASPEPGRVVVLGNFDGVHRGHREVARTAGDIARERGLTARIVTFHPHPSEVLGRGAPPLLTSGARKRELVEALDPPVELFEQRFDLDFAAQTPRQFAERLANEHRAQVVVVGAGFRFGRGRAGDLAALVELGRKLGFSALAQPLVIDADGPISSTRVRAAIADGRLEEAEILLGRPHMVEGSVEQGRRLGRTIGFPTCNLGGIAELVPALGIYATLVDLLDDEGRWVALARGATSVGTNPTVDDSGRRTVETYLFAGQRAGFDRELYGHRLRVHFVARLRPEERFADVDGLVRQMRLDVDAAAASLAARRPAPTGAWG